MKSLFTFAAIAAIAAALTGCLSIKTVTTPQVVKQPDGTLVTNLVTTTTTKNADPLKDKWLRYTESTVGFQLKMSPGPSGTSGSLSPFSLLFAKQKCTYDSLPIYPGVATGYTPPVAVAGSGVGSLWNDADQESMATAAGLLPGTNAYEHASTTTVNLLQPMSGTITTPAAPVVVTVTNTVPATTNAAAAKTP